MMKSGNDYINFLSRLPIYIAIAMFPCALSAQPPLKFNVLESYPFGYIEEGGKKVGTFWEYIHALNSHLTLNIEREIVPKTRVVEHLKLGIADAAIMFRAKNLQPYVEFVSKIREVPIVIVSKTRFSIDAYENLYDLERVGHFRSGSISPRFDSDNKINKIAIYTYPQMIEMLTKDRVSAIVGNGTIIQSLIKKQCLENELSISPLILGMKEQWLVFSKKSAYLHAIPEFKETLKELRSKGLLDQIFEKHLSYSTNNCRRDS